MKVVAKAKGQYKGYMYQPGDIFEFDENDKTNPRAPWMGDFVMVKVQSNVLPKTGSVPIK